MKSIIFLFVYCVLTFCSYSQTKKVKLNDCDYNKIAKELAYIIDTLHIKGGKCTISPEAAPTGATGSDDYSVHLSLGAATEDEMSDKCGYMRMGLALSGFLYKSLFIRYPCVHGFCISCPIKFRDGTISKDEIKMVYTFLNGKIKYSCIAGQYWTVDIP